jgi:N-acetylmuramoyl-L-alanine amidase
LAGAIFKAFEEYKNTIENDSKLMAPVIVNTDDKPANDTDEDEKPAVNAPAWPSKTTGNVQPEKTAKAITYKVQIKATTRPMSKSDKAFKLIGNLKYEKSKSIYKYVSGPYKTYDAAEKMLKKARKSGYKDAFIVVYKNGVRLSASEGKKYLD